MVRSGAGRYGRLAQPCIVDDTRPGQVKNFMIILGLTGSIGMGKTTAANMLRRMGLPVCDSDAIVHELLGIGGAAVEVIGNEFRGVVRDGAVDRPALGQQVFNDPDALKRLEAILHPLIRWETERQLAELKAPYCIIVIPLLLESNQRNLADRILVVDVSESLQITRTMQRDDISADQVRKILAAQVQRDSRLNVADDVIDNSFEMDDIRARVKELDQQYRALSENSV